MDDQGSIPGRGRDFFLFVTASRSALGPTQPPIQWVPVTLSPAVKRPGREAHHSCPSTAEVKKAWSYTFTPLCVLMAWCLVKHSDDFIVVIRRFITCLRRTFYATTVLCYLDIPAAISHLEELRKIPKTSNRKMHQ
jgi:hypothetical protein